MSRPGRAAVVLLAAGEGRRVGAGRNKVLLPLGGHPVLSWSLRTICDLDEVGPVVVVVREEDRAQVDVLVAQHLSDREVVLVEGGSTRHGSEWKALQAIASRIDSGAVDVVAIHDAARPLADRSVFENVLTKARRHGGAVPVLRREGLITRTADTAVTASPTGALVGVQTPQAFQAAALLDSYRRAEVDGFHGTDTASCLERYTDVPVHAVRGSAFNLKITFPEDVRLADRLLRKVGRA